MTTNATTPPADYSAWSRAECFVLRVAGLPIESLHQLRTPRTASWAEAVLDDEASLLDTGAKLADRLHEIIGAVGDDRVRRDLINLRRCLHNNKLLRDIDAVNHIIETLDPAMADSLRAWLANRRAWNERMLIGDQLLTDEVVAARTVLSSLVDEPRLRMGLQLASPTLDGYIEQYLKGSPSKPNKRQRRIERSLLEYIYRLAGKTSPFSTFTSVGLGAFTKDKLTPEGKLRISPAWRSCPRVNVSVLNRIAELIVDDEYLRGELLVTLTSGWQSDVERVRYMRRTVTLGDTEATVSFDSVRDSLFILRNSDVLRRVFTLLDSGRSLRWGELVKQLDVENGEAVELDEYVRVLFLLGLLRIPRLHVDIHEPDPLRAFTSALCSLGDRFSDNFADPLNKVATCLQRFPAAAITERRDLLAEMRSCFATIFQSLGARPDTLPVTLLFEDTRIEGSDLTIGSSLWTKGIEDSLCSLERLMPAFDNSLPPRLVLKGFFLARFGPGGSCDDLLKLVHDFNEDVFSAYMQAFAAHRSFDDSGKYVPQINWLQQAEINTMDKARRMFFERLHKQRQDRTSEDEELVLSDDLIEDVAAEMASVSIDFCSRSHFLQLASSGSGRLAVLNRTYGGVLYPFSRFTHCFSDVSVDKLRESLRNVQPDGAIFAELTGGHATTNLNIHDSLVDFEIVCPGETSVAAPEHQILFDDLFVEHDEATDRLVLRSKGRGVEVIPAYLGYLVPAALPEVPRTLLLFSPRSAVQLDPWEGIPIESAGEVVARPRVRHRDVVLARQSWSTRGDALPQRDANASDARHFLSWQRWRRIHGLPCSVFAAVHDPVDTTDRRFAARPKPHYVDFTSQLSLTLLESLIKSNDTQIVFQEMLPGEDDLFVWSEHGRHVAELVVETISSTRGAAGLTPIRLGEEGRAL